jgi:hypothetical protein
MEYFKADLHVHTVLSPCGDLDMSPVNIIRAAKQKGLDFIGIADHNSTRNAMVTKRLGEEQGIKVLTGVEVNTKEEVHCLAFFENGKQLQSFQEFLDEHMPNIKNNERLFGPQLIVDEEEMILGSEEKLLISALTAGINVVEEKVHALDGIFIPAHVTRPMNGLLAQLGSIPDGLKHEAIEIYYIDDLEYIKISYPELAGKNIIKNSDAHTPGDLARAHTRYYMENMGFNEIKQALRRENGRKTEIVVDK